MKQLMCLMAVGLLLAACAGPAASVPAPSTEADAPPRLRLVEFYSPL